MNKNQGYEQFKVKKSNFHSPASNITTPYSLETVHDPTILVAIRPKERQNGIHF